MSLIALNVRGMNTPQRIGDAFKLLIFKPTTVGLVENKLNHSNLILLRNKLLRNWDLLTNKSLSVHVGS